MKAWREEKLLLSQKEAELAVVMEMEKEAILRVERERKREREARTKGRIKAYRQRREVELEEEWLVAEKLRLVAEEEKKMISGRDQERVELRKQMLLEKLSKQREKREEVEEARRERERQLDRLREQVCLCVCFDRRWGILKHALVQQHWENVVEAASRSLPCVILCMYINLGSGSSLGTKPAGSECWLSWVTGDIFAAMVGQLGR